MRHPEHATEQQKGQPMNENQPGPPLRQEAPSTSAATLLARLDPTTDELPDVQQTLRQLYAQRQRQGTQPIRQQVTPPLSSWQTWRARIRRPLLHWGSFCAVLLCLLALGHLPTSTQETLTAKGAHNKDPKQEHALTLLLGKVQRDGGLKQLGHLDTCRASDRLLFRLSITPTAQGGYVYLLKWNKTAALLYPSSPADAARYEAGRSYDIYPGREYQLTEERGQLHFLLLSSKRPLTATTLHKLQRVMARTERLQTYLKRRPHDLLYWDLVTLKVHP